MCAQRNYVLSASSLALALVIAHAGCASQEETVESKCDRLRQHVVDLRMQSVPEADRVAHAAALNNALAGQFGAECKAMTAKQRDCALATNETAALASCTSSTSP